MEVLGRLQPLFGEVLPQGRSEAGRATEPDAGIAPTRYRGADALAGQTAITLVVENMQVNASGCSIGGQLGDGLLAVLGGGMEQVDFRAAGGGSL